MPAPSSGKGQRKQGESQESGPAAGPGGQCSVLTTGGRAQSPGEMQTDSGHSQEPEVAVIIPQNSFYEAGSDQTRGSVGISSLSYDMRDVKFLRKLLSCKVVVRNLKFVHNSRFLIRTIFHKKPLVKIKRISLPIKAARSINASKDNSRSCETVSDLVAHEPTVNVTFINDGDIEKITDHPVPHSADIERLKMSPLSYLKPSQSQDNYGLGGFQEMMKDDADQPRRVIPDWALEERVRRQMMTQMRTDANKIFAPRVLSVSDLCVMFPNKPEDIWKKPWCESPSPKKTARGKENRSKGTKKLWF